MSRENVDVVRRALGKIEDLFEVADPDIEFDISRTKDMHVVCGRDGVIEALQEWIDTWETYELEALELIDAPPSRVVTVMRERGQLKRSDAWVEHTCGAVWTIRNRRVTRYEEHPDRATALDAAGLTE